MHSCFRDLETSALGYSWSSTHARYHKDSILFVRCCCRGIMCAPVATALRFPPFILSYKAHIHSKFALQASIQPPHGAVKQNLYWTKWRQTRFLTEFTIPLLGDKPAINNCQTPWTILALNNYSLNWRKHRSCVSSQCEPRSQFVEIETGKTLHFPWI